MSALDSLSLRNGLKTTQSVLGKQQSGVDAVQKANPQETAARMNMNTAQAMLHGKENLLTPPKDAHEQAARMNQQTAEGMLHGEIPIVRKEVPKAETAPKQPEQPKRMSYAEMFKVLNGNGEETEEQKAKREKRDRRNAIISAVGDGLRSLADMYFATKGARVIHNPNTDLSAAQLKRKQMLDANREKNKSAWLNGYLKAQALDEEARKNDNTLAEQIRWHNMTKDNNDTKNDLSQQRIDQNERRLDLSKWKYQTDKDYKDSILKIKDMLAKGQIEHWQAQEAIQRMNAETGRIRANKSGSSRTGSYSGEIDEYMDLMDKDPQGMKEAEREVRGMGMSTKTAAGRKAQKIAYKKKHGGGKGSSSSSPSSNGGSSSNGGKKSTGVKW